MQIWMLFKLGIRNTLRNPVRTTINIGMIAGSFVALVLGKGFERHIVKNIENSQTTSITGHLQIANKDFWNNKATDNKSEKLISAADSLVTQIRENSLVQSVSSRQTSFVLVTKGDATISARVVSIAIEYEPDFFSQFQMNSGSVWSSDQHYQAVLGSGVAKSLNASVGDRVTLLAQTLDGGANAIDLEISGIGATGFTEFDNTNIITSNLALENLLNTKAKERIVIRAKTSKSLMALEHSILVGVLKDRPDLQVRQWRALAPTATSAENFLGMQNLLLQIVLSLIVFLGITNTVGMSVYERMGEIGTMRALGDSKKEIISNFLIEGFALAFLSLTLAVPGTLLLLQIASTLQVEILLPMSTRPIFVEFAPAWFDFVYAGVLTSAIGICSTYFPSRRASQVPVVEALRKSA